MRTAALATIGLAILLATAAVVRAGGPVTEPAVAFDLDAAVDANGAIPVASALTTCGSNTESYLAELLHVFPTDATVVMHWPDIVPGKVYRLSGLVTGSSLGSGDLPFDHPFGSDLNFDVIPDVAFAELNQFAPDGTQSGEEPAAQHVELEQGLLPHTADRPAGPVSGQPWYDMSAANRENLVDGFVPEPGDHVALMGHWIIDCGHRSYETEIHPVTFLASARTEGDATVARVFFNPYHVTQLYSPDPTVFGRVEDDTRFTNPAVKTFPSFLVDDIIGLLVGQIDHLSAGVLLEAEHDSPPAWRVCAPAGTSGTRLKVVTHFAVRPGVRLRFKRDLDAGCVTVTTTIGPDYHSPEPPLRACTLPWDWLNEQAAAEAGVPGLDILATIKSYLPESTWPLVENTPESACGDGLVADIPTRAARRRVVNPALPYPLIGSISVGWR